MNGKNLKTMTEIMTEKTKELSAGTLLSLDDEGDALARDKRKTFDLPTNAVKVDPLR